MRTGKILGIGAALSAGLIAANAASASVVTGVEVGFGISPSQFLLASAYTAGGEVYTSGGGNYGIGTSTPSGDTELFSWTDLNISATGTASLNFSVIGLGFTSPGYTSTFFATGKGFNSVGPSVTLNSTGGGAYSGGSGSVGVTQTGYAAASNAGYGRTDATSSDTLSGNGGGTFNSSSVSNSSVTDLVTAPYSLTYELKATPISSGVSLGTTADPVGGTVSILGGSSNAVALPGSGPLTIVGGLVMIGGLAIRRRMKA